MLYGLLQDAELEHCALLKGVERHIKDSTIACYVTQIATESCCVEV